MNRKSTAHDHMSLTGVIDLVDWGSLKSWYYGGKSMSLILGELTHPDCEKSISLRKYLFSLSITITLSG